MLRAPNGVQALIDMASLTMDAGMQQMLVRHEYFTPRAGAAATKGAPFRSTIVNYDNDCATRRTVPTLTAWCVYDRRLIASERNAGLAHTVLPTVDAQNELAAAVDMACEKLAAAGLGKTVPPFDAAPVGHGDTSGSSIITQVGHILIHKHVAQQCEALEVGGNVKPAISAQLIAANTWCDLALIKVERHVCVQTRRRAPAKPWRSPAARL